MAKEEKIYSYSLDEVGDAPTNLANGANSAAESCAECIQRLKEQIEWLKEKHCLKERIWKLEEERRSEQSLWQEQLGQKDEEIKKLKQERAIIGDLEDIEMDDNRVCHNLQVDFYILISRPERETVWRFCKLDTGSPVHNLIARSALRGLSPKKRDYKGPPLAGLGSELCGIKPKEEVELEWHVNGKSTIYTTWFTVWEEESGGRTVSLSVDVLLGNKTIAEKRFLVRNPMVYPIRPVSSQYDNDSSTGEVSTNGIHDHGSATSFSTPTAQSPHLRSTHLKTEWNSDLPLGS